MSRFTKGPWRVDPEYKFDIQTSDGSVEICTLDSDGFNHADGIVHGFKTPTEEEADANARLIAAAPDMYEALENLLIAIGMGWDTEGCEDVAKAVLAKARGE